MCASTRTDPNIDRTGFSRAVNKKGVLTIGHGDQIYIDMAINLAKSIALNSPGIPISIVTDSQDSRLDKYFDSVIPINLKYGIGLVQKLYLYEYSPYEETLYLDADSYVVKPIDFLFSAFEGSNVSVMGQEMTNGDWAGFDISEMMNKLNIDYVVPFNGGMYYFAKTDMARQIYTKAQELLVAYDALGIAKLRGYYNEEPLMSLAMASFHEHPISNTGNGMCMPIGKIENMQLDVLLQICSFIKNGRYVEPAIIHFGSGLTGGTLYKRELRKINVYEVFRLPKPVISYFINTAYQSKTIHALYKILQMTRRNDRQR